VPLHQIDYDNEAMGVKTQPPRARLEQTAAENPELINAYVAYFVYEWQEVTASVESHGTDQCGEIRRVPDYVGILGLDACMRLLREAPNGRGRKGPGGISRWLAGIS